MRLILVLLAAAWPACGGQWQSLFDGRTLDGWHVAARPADRAKVFWQARDGAILCDSLGRKQHDYVWLVSNREYENFVLEFEVRGFPESPGNSGVQFRSRYDEEMGWLNGPQVDVHPPAPWRTGLIYDETRESRRWIFPSLKDWAIERPQGPGKFRWKAGRWNRVRLECRLWRVRTEVNGLVVADFDARAVLDDEAHRRRGAGRKGHFALQLHSGDELRIEYRKLRVRVLP